MEKTTEKGRSNFFAMTCHTIMVVILLLAYAVETFVKHDRAWWYFLIMLVLGGVPVIVEQMTYKKDNETDKLKYYIGYGFLIFYAFLLFTANNPLTFTYIMLIIMVVCVFNDKKFAMGISIINVIMNVIQVVIGASTGSLGYTTLAGAEIQVIIMIMMACYSIFMTEVLNKNNMQKLDTIKKQQMEEELRYNNTIEVVSQMTANINDIYSRVEKISESTDNTRNAMEEVTKGSADTSEAVQNQLLQTQSIQKNLSEVDSASKTLLNEMNLTKSEIETGKVNMGNMVERVNESVESGREVAGQLETLDEKIKEMNSIVGIINGITSKTALLALNASIEAARAGEAGRGFSVVASEISDMATQTKNATVHITELIQNVSEAISEVVAVIRTMIESINLEKEITESTEHSFIQITDSSHVMNENIIRLTEILTELVKANTDIIDSVQTISGISEEVSAHATETFDAEEDNVCKLHEISELMHELKDLASKL